MRALIAFAFLFAAGACAPRSDQPETDQRETSALTIEDAWAAPTPQGVEVSAGYLYIRNATATDQRLLTATSPRAERVEIHEMTMAGDVMRMRPVQSLTIPAGGEIRLAPGGMHLMFYGVAQPFTEGEEIPVALTFETASRIDVVLPVLRNSQESHGGH